MKRKNSNRLAIVLTTILVLSMILQIPLIGTANAEVPAPRSWTGNGAMAHWDIETGEDETITMDAVYGQRTSDGKTDMIYVKVVHPQGTSEVTGYKADISSGPTWRMNHVFINATLTFNWTSGNMPHPITIEWFASPPSTSNEITWQNGSTSYLPGEWISGTGNVANATITIGGAGPHPSTYVSNWAAVGQTPAITSVDWVGKGAMAQWNIIDVNHGNVPITIEAEYGQKVADGSGTNMIRLEVIHPQGVSAAIGYTANMSSPPIWSIDHVVINATLSFNWGSANVMHPIVIEWFTTPPTTSNTITWANGSTAYLPGEWRSDDEAYATITIGGSGPHPSTYVSSWAAVGVTPQFPTPSFTGAGSMAHWDIIDDSHGNAVISIDALYAQNPNDNSGKTNMVWVKVIHPQGVSEVTGYAEDITAGPYYTMSSMFLNATLRFNWTSGNLVHPIAISWVATSESVENMVTWQNGTIVPLPGQWRDAVATMTIGGAGPHPDSYASNWAVYGWMEAKPSAPTALSVTNVAAQEVTLSWNDNAYNADGFRIQRSTTLDFSQNVVLFTVEEGETTFTDDTIVAGTRYFYRVEAFNAAGESTWSNTVSSRTPATAAPTNLAVAKLGTTTVRLTFKDNSISETGFIIERATDKLFTENLDSFSAGPNAGNMGTFTDNTAEPNTRYYYRVAATSTDGTTAWSNFARAVTLPMALEAFL